MSSSKGALSRAESRQALGFVSPALVGLGLFTLFPVGLSIVMSLFNWPTFGTRTFNGFGNYLKLFTVSPDFWPAMRNTFVFAIAYVPINIACSLGLAVALSSRIRGRGALRVLFFIPVVTPMVANALIWRVMLDDGGVVNGMLKTIGITGPSWLGHPVWAMVSLILMSLWQAIGYNIVVLAAGLNNINPAVMEAARIDGTTAWSRFWKVTFPMLSPSLFFASVMTVIGAFKVFTQPFMLTKGGPGESTNTLVLHLYRSAFSYDKLGLASSLAWVLFVLVMLMTALQFVGQKRWVNYAS